MSPTDPQPTCPHCGEVLLRLTLPEETSWGGEEALACFNDSCPYFVRGWQWMESQFGAKASYRYRVDPASGRAMPLAVWSRSALRDRIVDQGADGGREPDIESGGDGS